MVEGKSHRLQRRNCQGLDIQLLATTVYFFFATVRSIISIDFENSITNIFYNKVTKQRYVYDHDSEIPNLIQRN